MLYSGVHVHCDDRAEQINTKYREKVEFKGDKPGGTYTKSYFFYFNYQPTDALT